MSSDGATVQESDTVLTAVVDSVAPHSRHNPYDSYRILRAAGPFVPGPHDARLVAGYAEARAILQDARWSHAEEPQLLHGDSDVELPGSFLWQEPPEHTRLRGLVGQAFTARTVAGLRDRAEELAAGLVDGIRSRDRADLIEELAYPLPLTMICELLGVPAECHEHVRDMSAAISRGLDPDFLLAPEELAARSRAVREFEEFFGDLLRQRARSPRADLISALVRAEAEGARLTPTELLGTLLILVVAGHETTVNLIANGVLALIRHPAEFDRLRADPATLCAPAVDEVLRYDPPVHLTTRTAHAEIEVGGTTFAPGDAVIVMMGSANRDGAAFADPDRFDITRYLPDRGTQRHLSFGLGLHYCLGAPLARLEMQAVLGCFAERVATLTLCEEPPYRPNVVVRGMSRLLVEVRSR
ncbi:cytochrome P450 [Nocardia sp. BMG111209]|uniref:cytochrome P450 n=1 Tax=Nocardia sp. BMG111209 TaxID=1160137 RepID=UPI000370411C|nr:cytochrome P450 [Nocardia sp. BMG111209]